MCANARSIWIVLSHSLLSPLATNTNLDRFSFGGVKAINDTALIETQPRYSHVPPIYFTPFALRALGGGDVIPLEGWRCEQETRITVLQGRVSPNCSHSKSYGCRSQGYHDVTRRVSAAPRSAHLFLFLPHISNLWGRLKTIARHTTLSHSSYSLLFCFWLTSPPPPLPPPTPSPHSFLFSN